MSKEKEAMFYTPLKDSEVKCNLCGRRCLIAEGGRGTCMARINKGGILYTISYARSCSTSVDPIEKKPLFHFHPGSKVLSVSSPFCNFFCRFCNNWTISQQRSISYTEKTSPEQVVYAAKQSKTLGISYTYTEPTTFYEWVYDSSRLANESGLINTIVTNGYMTPEAVETISPYLDAATVDFKGGGDPKFYREMMRVPSVEPIYECLKALKKCKIHVEITNLVVPEYGDSEEYLRELASWVRSHLGQDTPFHILRFYPNYEIIDLPWTPLATINQGVKIAREEGLRYVYAGNVSDHDGENTNCPKCGKLLIRRDSFNITLWCLTSEMRCPDCQEKIPIVGVHHL